MITEQATKGLPLTILLAVGIPLLVVFSISCFITGALIMMCLFLKLRSSPAQTTASTGTKYGDRFCSSPQMMMMEAEVEEPVYSEVVDVKMTYTVSCDNDIPCSDNECYQAL